MGCSLRSEQSERTAQHHSQLDTDDPSPPTTLLPVPLSLLPARLEMFSTFLASSKSFLADVQSTVRSVLDDEKAQYEAEKAKIEQQRAAREKQAAKEKSREGVALWSVWGTQATAAAKAATASAVEQAGSASSSSASSATPVPASTAALEKELQSKILKLSLDRRTFLAPAPDSSAFSFPFDSAWPLAQYALRLDPKLDRARFLLVPRKLTEEVFWRNYFYRVEMIRRTAKVPSIFDMPEEEAQRRKQIAAANMPLARPAAAGGASAATASASSGKAIAGGALKPGASKADDVSSLHSCAVASRWDAFCPRRSLVACA